jgi:hypothetical protein
VRRWSQLIFRIAACGGDVGVVDEETRPTHAGQSIRCNLNSEVVEDDERAGEPVDPDPIVPMVGAN